MRVDRHGDLVLETAAGEIRQRKPVVYQEKEIAGRYAISARREEASFEVGPYDASKPLVIDPVLVYSSYLGGNGGDQGNAISVDSAGQAYVTGTTGSSNFPIVLGSQSRGSATAFLSKISADGKSLIFSTYLGGTGSATGAGFAMDPAGNVFISGSTVATDFPVVNAYQPRVNKASGFSISAFVTKLNPDDSKVLFSAYLAGSKDDSCGRAGSGRSDLLDPHCSKGNDQ